LIHFAGLLIELHVTRIGFKEHSEIKATWNHHLNFIVSSFGYDFDFGHYLKIP